MASSVIQVQGTNDNSTVSKLSTSQTGYFNDPFLSCFTTHSSRRAPLIHWGYWIRFQALDWVLRRFLDNNTLNTKQIISLGAGFDTTYFRLKSEGILNECLYVEIDYPEVVARKQAIISSHDHLSYSTNEYILIGCDLRYLNSLERSLIQAGIKQDTPTLLIAEVVLTYIKPKCVDAIINWSAQYFSNAVFTTYEQINPSDGFGQVMLRHFKSLSSPLLNIHSYPTEKDHQLRYIKHGWSEAYSCDMNVFYASLPSNERGKPLLLEPFDEYEEWHLKCGHYQILCALKGTSVSMRDRLSPPLISTRDCLSPLISFYDKIQVIGSDNKWTIKCDDLWQLQRFGHTSVQIQDSFLIYGGFGKSGPSLAHSRLNSILSLQKRLEKWEATEIHLIDNGPGRIMYHTMTLLPSCDVLITGGRSSPQNPNSIVYLLKRDLLSSEKWEWRKPQLLNDETMEGRWRHTATLINESVVIIIGGCTTGGRVLNDILLLDTSNWKIEKLSLTLPRGRHSHSTIRTRKGEVLILGGLDSDLCPLDLSLRLSQDEIGQWSLEPYLFTPLLPPRYSMTCHYKEHDDVIIIFGGVQLDCSNNQYPIILANLKERTWNGIQLNCSLEMPIPLLHGHSSHLIMKENGLKEHEKDELLIIGGGGNCFSFGTHFNINPMFITCNLNSTNN